MQACIWKKYKVSGEGDSTTDGILVHVDSIGLILSLVFDGSTSEGRSRIRAKATIAGRFEAATDRFAHTSRGEYESTEAMRIESIWPKPSSPEYC